MKKIISIVLVFVTIALTFAGCTTKKDIVPTATPGQYDTFQEQFRYDNFADGRMIDSFLDSINPGGLAVASCCMYYEWRIKKGIENGEKWTYTKSPKLVSFDNILKSKKLEINTDMLPIYALYDLGILTEGQRFYGDSDGKMEGEAICGKYINAVCDIYSWGGRCNWKELNSYNMVKAGDIFISTNETYLYLGDGKMMDLSVSEDGAEISGAVLLTSASDKASSSIYYQISFKDEYVPKTYRNVQGKLVSNPIYNEATSIEYKEGTSSEEIVIQKGIVRKDAFEFYTGTRENVLASVSFSKENSFRIRSVECLDNMTDNQLYFDASSESYAQIKLLGDAETISNPTTWYNINGEASNTKDETHKYIAGMYTALKETKVVDSFSLYSQNLDNNLEYIQDIEGFDILVSTDGKNWTVVSSISNATDSKLWNYVTDEKNLASNGKPFTHYISANFEAVPAKYIAFGFTEPKNTTSPGWYKFSELMVFSAE